MTLLALTPDEREVVRRCMEATFQFFTWDFQTRLGITPDSKRALLADWSNVNDGDDTSDACLAINNTLNDPLHGVGIDDKLALHLTGADRAEMRRIFSMWASGRGWDRTGLA